MTERPIIFTGPNVCAIQRDESPKTQTRRIPTYMNTLVDGRGVGKKEWDAFEFNFDEAYVDKYPSEGDSPGPYFQVPSEAHGTTHRLYSRVVAGDWFWVRENLYNEDGDWAYEAGPGWVKDAPDDWLKANCSKGIIPSIHMPRWASRILLGEIDVRIGRVQEITEEDAIAEGVQIPVSENGNWLQALTGGYIPKCPTFREHFIRLWDSIYKKRGHGWDENGWCWIYGWPPYKGAKP